MSPRRNLTLDLNAAAQTKKSARLGGMTPGGELLTSPDVHKLKLESPQVYEFLKTLPQGATPTPSALGYTFPNPVQMQQPGKPPAQLMGGGGGIVMSQPPPMLPSTLNDVGSSRPSSSASGESTEIKLEPGVITESPKRVGRQATKRQRRSSSVSSDANIVPINMNQQESIKLERKRLRNRLAATKCRKKKLDKISKLQEKVTGMKTENVNLAEVLKKLKQNVYNLKEQVVEHANAGCQIGMLQ